MGSPRLGNRPTSPCRERTQSAGLLMVALLVLLAPACSGEKEAKLKRCAPAAAPGVSWVKCQLQGDDLSGANLTGAFLSNVDLREANLTGANLSGANIVSTQFDDAVLTKANFSGTTISGGTIQKGKFCNTVMPSGKLASADC